jgi:hypothetical protein
MRKKWQPRPPRPHGYRCVDPHAAPKAALRAEAAIALANYKGAIKRPRRPSSRGRRS